MKLPFILSTLIILSSATLAQNKFLDVEPDGKLNLAGKWKVTCGQEYVNESKLQFCDLCPFVINKSNASQAELKDVEVEFTYDTIKLNRNGELLILPYTMNNNNHSFQMELNKRKQTFRVFYGKTSIILEDQDGMVAILVREK